MVQPKLAFSVCCSQTGWRQKLRQIFYYYWGGECRNREGEAPAEPFCVAISSGARLGGSLALPDRAIGCAVLSNPRRTNKFIFNAGAPE
jgi:hypothetical protein